MTFAWQSHHSSTEQHTMLTLLCYRDHLLWAVPRGLCDNLTKLVLSSKCHDVPGWWCRLFMPADAWWGPIWYSYTHSCYPAYALMSWCCLGKTGTIHHSIDRSLKWLPADEVEIVANMLLGEICMVHVISAQKPGVTDNLLKKYSYQTTSKSNINAQLQFIFGIRIW